MKRCFLGASLAIVLLCMWLSVTTAAPLDWIFADSFESGNVSAWSWATGPTQVIPEAASEGAFGLRVPTSIDLPAWVQDENATGEAIVRSDFDLNTDNLTMADGDSFALYVGWTVEDASAAFVVSLVADSDQIGLRITAQDATGGQISSTPIPLPSPGWHRIGLEYGAGTGPAGGGEMRLYINGALEAELQIVENQDLLVNALRLGAVGGVDQGTSGSIDIDVYTTVRLFDPWPCSAASNTNPIDGMPVCLDGEGRFTDVAAGGCGDGMVVWRGSEDLDAARSRLGGIYGRPVSGSVRQINETFLIVQDEAAATPAIGMNATCRTAVAWQSTVQSEAIFARVIAIDGTPQTPLVQVGAGADSEQWPAIAIADTGRFFVVWRRTLGTGDSVWGRIFGDDGVPSGPAFQIDGGGGGAISPPSLAMSSDGSAVVAWESSGAVLGHLFDNAGTSLGQVVLADGPGDGEPSVAMMADGDFVAVWTRQGADRRVFLRRFTSSGGPISGELRVDTLTPADCSEPDVEVGQSNEIAVVWSSLDQDVHSILGRRVSPSGVPVGAVFEIQREGRVWIPRRPRVAAAERLLLSHSEQTEFLGIARGAVIGVDTQLMIFADDFESGSLIAWSNSVP